MKRKLNINIDHIATLRQARLGSFPDPIDAIKIIKEVKADGVVTVSYTHLTLPTNREV